MLGGSARQQARRQAVLQHGSVACSRRRKPGQPVTNALCKGHAAACKRRARTCPVGVRPSRKQHFGHRRPVSQHCHNKRALSPHILLVGRCAGLQGGKTGKTGAMSKDEQVADMVKAAKQWPEKAAVQAATSQIPARSTSRCHSIQPAGSEETTRLAPAPHCRHSPPAVRARC